MPEFPIKAALCQTQDALTRAGLCFLQEIVLSKGEDAIAWRNLGLMFERGAQIDLALLPASSMKAALCQTQDTPTRAGLCYLQAIRVSKGNSTFVNLKSRVILLFKVTYILIDSSHFDLLEQCQKEILDTLKEVSIKDLVEIVGSYDYKLTHNLLCKNNIRNLRLDRLQQLLQMLDRDNCVFLNAYHSFTKEAETLKNKVGFNLEDLKERQEQYNKVLTIFVKWAGEFRDNDPQLSGAQLSQLPPLIRRLPDHLSYLSSLHKALNREQNKVDSLLEMCQGVHLSVELAHRMISLGNTVSSLENKVSSLEGMQKSDVTYFNPSEKSKVGFSNNSQNTGKRKAEILDDDIKHEAKDETQSGSVKKRKIASQQKKRARENTPDELLERAQKKHLVSSLWTEPNQRANSDDSDRAAFQSGPAPNR